MEYLVKLGEKSEKNEVRNLKKWLKNSVIKK